MRYVIFLLLLLACQAPPEPERIALVPPVEPEKVVLTEEATLTGCEDPVISKENCLSSYCAQQGGTCTFAEYAQNGTPCYICTIPECPEGTLERNVCELNCTTCQQVAKIGSKWCYACVQQRCPAEMYDEQGLCDLHCSSKCVATKLNTEWCYECRK